jgi:hypothetical protein
MLNMDFKKSNKSTYNQYHKEQLLRIIKETIYKVDETSPGI